MGPPVEPVTPIPSIHSVKHVSLAYTKIFILNNLNSLFKWFIQIRFF